MRKILKQSVRIIIHDEKFSMLLLARLKMYWEISKKIARTTFWYLIAANKTIDLKVSACKSSNKFHIQPANFICNFVRRHQLIGIRLNLQSVSMLRYFHPEWDTKLDLNCNIYSTAVLLWSCNLIRPYSLKKMSLQIGFKDFFVYFCLVMYLRALLFGILF